MYNGSKMSSPEMFVYNTVWCLPQDFVDDVGFHFVMINDHVICLFCEQVCVHEMEKLVELVMLAVSSF